MNALYEISTTGLLVSLIPALPVVYILWRWRLRAGNALYAIGRMLAQLVIIGYFLAILFRQESWLVGLAVVSVMVFASSWISLNVIPDQRKILLQNAVVGLGVGGGIVLAVITLGVLQLDPWYTPRYSIPLAGMVFANSMNSVSLAAERLLTERERGIDFTEARGHAMNTAMIPVVNSLFAVGLVALPGMMTGQILSGVSPLIAARYQIVVMLMIFASAGLAAAIFLQLSRGYFETASKAE